MGCNVNVYETFRQQLRALQVEAQRFLIAGEPIPEELATDLAEFGWLAGEEE